MRTLSKTLFLFALVLPFSASALTAADLQTQVQALLAQVQQLQSQVVVTPTGGAPAGGTSTGTGTAGFCPQIGRTLKTGSTGNDVTRLQQFLALDPTIYPEAKMTGYFGGLTQAAVQRWQVKFHIVSTGSPATTGYGVVGPRTAAAIAIVCGGGSYNGVVQTIVPGGAVAPASNVGGFIQVSPIQGNSPLPVNITATINTSDSCDATVYVLDYGDGSTPALLPSAAGACQQQQMTLQHTYQFGGVYTVSLSAGGHKTTALVAVTGPLGTGGSSSTTTTTTQIPAGAQINIGDSQFTPQHLTVNSGTQITWTNKGSLTHTVTSDNNSWGSGDLTHGQSYSLTFTTPGDYPYYCKYHGGAGGVGMSGVITVTAPNPTNTSTNPSTNTSTNTSSNPPGTITSSSSGNVTYGSMSVTPGVGGNLATVQAKFDTPGCIAYSFDWGDDSSNVTKAASTNCQTPLTLTHTYTTSGSFDIQLTRGSQVDDATVVVSQ
jgi:plastocyanin